MHNSLKLLETETCLVEELSNILSKKDLNSLKNMVIVLPTHRLAVCLLAAIAPKFKFFQPPKILTLDVFLKEYGIIDQKSGVLDEITLEILLGTIIRNENYETIRLGMEHELGKLYETLLEENLFPHGFQLLEEIFSEDIFKTQGALDYLRKKSQELLHVLQTLKIHLDSKNYITQVEEQKILANSFFKLLKQEPPWKELIIAGFTTIKPFLLPLWKKLSELSSTEIWITKPPKILSSLNPLAELLDKIYSYKITEAENEPWKEKNLWVLQADNPLQETQEILIYIDKILKSGCLAHKIGLVVTSEGTYAPILKQLTKNFEFEVNFAASLQLHYTELGIWLHCLMDFLFEPNNTSNCLRFILNPITFRWIKKEEELEKEVLSYYFSNIQKFNFMEDDLLRINSEFIPLMNRVRKELNSLYKSLKNPKPTSLQKWHKLFSKIMKVFQITQINKADISTLEQSTFDACEYFLEQLLISSSVIDAEIFDGFHFWRLVQDKILTLEVRSVGYPLKGVQVIKLTEARFVPFDYLFILGSIEGFFPKALPKDILMDDWLKTKIGLKGWAYVEALEDTTFHLLFSRINNLILSYPSTINDQDMIRSRFIEAFQYNNSLKHLNHLSYSEFQDSRQCRIEIQLEKSFLTDETDRYCRDFSATSLETFFQCPYRFLLQKKEIRSLKLLQNSDAMEEGKNLHEVLKHFFSSEYRNKIPPFPKNLPFKDAKKILWKRLVDITKSQIPESSSLFLHLYFFSWPKFIDFILPFYKKHENKLFWRFQNTLSEKKVLNQITLKKSKETINLKGFIDAVHTMDNGYLLIDYKRKNIPSSKDFSQVLFYVYSLFCESEEKYPIERSVCGYYSIIDGKWLCDSSGENSNLDFHKELKSNKKSEQQIDSMLRVFDEIFFDIKENKKFLAKPSPKCQYCEYQGVCRSVN